MTNLVLFVLLWASEAGFQSTITAAIHNSSSWKTTVLDNNWLMIKKFACNFPRIEETRFFRWNRRYRGAILDYGKSRHLHRNQSKPNVGQQMIGKQILLLRKKSTESEFVDRLNKTWILNSRDNTWRSVQSKVHPSCGEVCLAITLCDSQLVVIGGSTKHATEEVVLNDRISLFDGDEESWFEPRIVNSELVRKFKWDIQTVAVAIVDSESTNVSNRCRCKESVLLFPQTTRYGPTWASFLKLKCVHDRQKYEWKEIDSSPSPLPQVPMTDSLAAVKESVYVYVLAENGLWQFNAKKSKWNCINDSRTLGWHDWSEPLFGRRSDKLRFKAYATEDSYILYDGYFNVVQLLYDFVKNVWTLSKYFNVAYSDRLWVTDILTVDRRIVLLEPTKCVSEVWEIARQTENLWVWNMIQTASSWPYREDGLFTSVLQEDYLYLSSSSKNGYFTQGDESPIKQETLPTLGPFTIAERSAHLLYRYPSMKNAVFWMSNYLDFGFWRLSMRTLTWEKIWTRPTSDVRQKNFIDTAVVDTITYMSRSLIAMTGMRRLALKSTSFLPLLHVWGYNPDDGAIIYCKTAQDLHRPEPTTRYLYAVASLNSSSILLFGGTSSNPNKDNRSPYHSKETLHHSLNDTWIATIDIRRRYVQWTRIDVDHQRRHESQMKNPVGRFKHTMVRTTYAIVMYGGETNDHRCLNEVWHYDVSNLSWTNATSRVSNDKPRLYYRCFSIGTSLKNNAVFAVDSEKSLDLWLYHPETFSWRFMTRIEYTKRWNKEVSLFSLHVWKRHLLIYDSQNVEVVYSYLFCPEGFSTAPLSATQTVCSGCGAGLFSKRDAYECTRCPIGLTTEGSLSTSVFNCNRCDTNYCKQGQCDLIREDVMTHAVCHCDNGYSGTQCQYPTYILIALGVVALVFLLISIGGLIFWRYRVKKRQRERNLVQQVNELTDVWQIDSTEIKLLEQIGRGAFGEVFRAEYRDMIVAVKTLRCHEDEQSVREFEREIQFCQTIRHPHIVLFIGAGRREAEGTPFIVIEFMERGSLRDLLDDVGITLLPHQKVQFGVDIASGMHFLHGLQPPRIHRDLKSNNILVGRNLSAKVADFGLGRQMPVQTRDIVVGDTQTEGLTTPLLNSICLTTIGIGTSRWRAPELIARQNYTTAIDVYSFGILLWEIWTRRLPFQNYSFDYEVHGAVLAGERPIIPKSCPADFQGVMTNCWQQESCARPLFSEIVGRLRNGLVN